MGSRLTSQRRSERCSSATVPEAPRMPSHVRHVFEAGFSQDGGFTFTQADVFNVRDRLPGGGPVYDGYVPGGTTGPSDINFGLTPAGSLSPGDPRNRMQPRDSPVIQINTETEEALLGASDRVRLSAARQRCARRPLPAVGGSGRQPHFQRSRQLADHRAARPCRDRADSVGRAPSRRVYPPAVHQRPMGRRGWDRRPEHLPVQQRRRRRVRRPDEVGRSMSPRRPAPRGSS